MGDKAALEVYKRRDEKWAWRLVVSGEVVATDGGQGYESVSEAHRMAKRVVSGHYFAAANAEEPA